MAESQSPRVPPPTPDQRRVAAGQFERANQVIATGNFDYGIQLLLTCCKLDPANLIYRQSLRRTEKVKFKNNQRGAVLAFLSSSGDRAKLKSAKRAREYLKALEHGEQVLTRNPWDVGVQLEMAEAADGLGLLDLAVWLVEGARQKDAKDLTVNKTLARLYEKRGNFSQAIALWELIRKAHPNDQESQNKGKDLAANHTIARGNYGAVVSDTPDADVSKDKPAAEAETSRPSSREFVLNLPSADRVANEAAPLRAKIGADPTNPHTYLQLANVYRRACQFDQARAILEEGLGPTGNHFNLIVELNDLQVEPFRQNLALVQEKLKRQPDAADLKQIRDDLLKEINARELELFRIKVDRFPTDKTSRFELGVRLLRAGQVEEAIKELQVVRTDPRHQWRALLYLGYSFQTRKNWRLAQRNFEEALQHLPANEEATRKELLFELAKGTAAAGDFEKAVEFGMELANLDFGYRDIGRLLDEWQAKQQPSKKV